MHEWDAGFHTLVADCYADELVHNELASSYPEQQIVQLDDKPENPDFIAAGFLQTTDQHLFESSNEPQSEMAPRKKDSDLPNFEDFSVDRFFDTNTDISAVKKIINPDDTQL